MNESMLRSFLQILAYIARANSKEPIALVRSYVEIYLERNYGKSIASIWIKEFEGFLLNSKHNLQLLCEDINAEYPLPQKFLLLISILNFFSSSTSKFLGPVDSSHDILADMADWLNIDKSDFLSCRFFTQGALHNIPNQTNLLIASATNPGFANIHYLQSKGLKGTLVFLLIPNANLLLLYYNGASRIELNGKPIYTNQAYILSSGLMVTGNGIEPIYYGQVIRAILRQLPEQQVTLTATNVCFNYSETAKGINNLSLQASSGELMGIMGGSGVGKSTLIKLLTGDLEPNSGRVLLNGQPIDGIKKGYRSIIGVLHQEESLIEELTVYENLFYSARLSVGKLSNNQVHRIVGEKLTELDLLDCQSNRVGPPGNRQLSGGQRKRLAIAMELVRNPSILFADEPTSGLSSADSEVVMGILKNIALKGTLVIVNIHQPSSDIFKMFDRLLILDRGGIPIYLGNPIQAILHFKALTDRVDKQQSGCEYCATVKPELLFELIEARDVDTLGRRLINRKVTPEEWFQHFNKDFNRENFNLDITPIPRATTPLAASIAQYKSFFLRNAIAKFRNSEFMLLSLLLPPMLAAIVSIFLRFAIALDLDASGYSLYSNPNLASFFLMCILSSLFFGLTLSCEDIVRDRQIIVRERFMGLSIRCYYNAKVAFLVFVSAYQALAYTIIGSAIMELSGMAFHLWLALFLISLFGNMVGLIISSALRSVVAIYILVPFLLIPQILFSGLVVRFDHLNPKFSSQDVVPLAGEVMASRWAAEALVVHFYTSNQHIKPIFPLEMQESHIRYRLLNLIPTLQQQIPNYPITDSIPTTINRDLIINGIAQLSIGLNTPNPNLHELSDDIDFIIAANGFIGKARDELSQRFGRVRRLKDEKILELFPNTPEGREELLGVRDKHHNRSIDDLVRSRYYPTPIAIEENQFIQKVDPIFLISPSKLARSHYLAPYKPIGNMLIETFWFNSAVIGLMAFLCYLLLLSNAFSTTARWRSLKLPSRIVNKLR